MADRQWFLTKLAGAIMTLFVLISTGVGAANLVTDLRRDITRNEENHSKHEMLDEKKWEKIFAEVDGNREDIHTLELQDKEIAIRQQTILEALKRIELKIDSFEVVN
jgi:hypothetical protein